MDDAKLKWLKIFGGVVYCLLVGDFARLLITAPAAVRPLVAVFGERPLGLPPQVLGVLLMAVFLLSLFAFIWHLLNLSLAVASQTGQPQTVRGITGMLRLLGRSFVLRNSDSTIHHHFVRSVASISAFVFLVTTWIVATGVAGV